MRSPIRRVLQAVQEMPWAIQPSKLEAIMGMLELRAEGREVPFEAARPREVQRVAKVAILPMVGVIGQRMGMMTEFSGGVSTERLGELIDAAVADAEIGAIVLDVDSPGGGVYGVPELAAKIRAARDQKRVIAVANSLMASAAYWLSSQASEVVASPSSEVGSVGVVATHIDQSGLDEAMGLKVTFVHAGAHKVEGNPHQPLSPDALEFLQQRVNEYYSMFLDAVAQGRGLKAKQVQEQFGGGRVFGAQEAVQRKMADRVATLDQVVAELGHSLARQAKPPRAELDRARDLELRRRQLDGEAAHT